MFTFPEVSRISGLPVIQISTAFSNEKLFGVIVNRAPNDRGSHLEKMWSKLLVGAKEVSGNVLRQQDVVGKVGG